MRRAAQIISLVLMVALGIQSCAVAVGGSVSEELSTNGVDKQEAKDLSGGGAVGLLAALLWLIAAAFVMSKPKVAMWIYGLAAVFCAIGAGTGFSDLWIWTVVSLIFALMSWRGIGEKEQQEAEKRERYREDVQAATEAALKSDRGGEA